MTTAVKIDAHAGWDVEVTLRHVSRNMKYDRFTASVETHVVPAHTEQTFYVHDGVEIIRVAEIKLAR
jgi:hypothetical protein